LLWISIIRLETNGFSCGLTRLNPRTIRCESTCIAIFDNSCTPIVSKLKICASWFRIRLFFKFHQMRRIRMWYCWRFFDEQVFDLKWEFVFLWGSYSSKDSSQDSYSYKDSSKDIFRNFSFVSSHWMHYFFRRISRVSDSVDICILPHRFGSFWFAFLVHVCSLSHWSDSHFWVNGGYLNVKTVFTYVSSWRSVPKVCMPKKSVQLS
jgi:hypothetical protein